MKMGMKVTLYLGLAAIAVVAILSYLLSPAAQAGFARLGAWMELPVAEMKIWQLLLALIIIKFTLD